MSSSRHIRVWLPAVFWGAAAAALSSTFSGAWGTVAASTAALGGALLPSLFLQGQPTGDGFVFRGRWGLPALLLLTASAPPVAWLLYRLLSSLDIQLRYALVLPESIALTIISCSGVCLTRSLVLRFPTLGLAEGGLLAAAVAQLLSLHRHAHLKQPFWVTDIFTSHGMAINPFVVFGLFGVIAAVGLLLLGWATTRRSARPLVALATILLLALATATVWTFTVTPPSPQHEQLPPPPPPNPPQQNKRIAVIRFQDACPVLPPFAGLFFRTTATAALDDLERPAIATETGDRGVSGVVTNGEQARSAPTEEPDGGQLVRTEVTLCVSLPQPPALLTGAITRFLPTANKEMGAFAVSSLVPRLTDIPGDITTGPTSFGDIKWDLSEWAASTNHPFDKPLGSFYAGLQQRLGLVGQPPGLRLQRLIRWCNQSLVIAAGDTGEASRPHAWDLLTGSNTGDAKEVAISAAMLFRMAGIPSRLAEGYRYPTTASVLSQGAEITLESRHQQVWPEVHVTGSGWLPVVLETRIADPTEQPLPPPPLPAVTGCVASIAFEDDYQPASRLGAMYLRMQVFDQYKQYTLLSTGSNPMSRACWEPETDGWFDPSMRTQADLHTNRHVRTTVRLLQPLDTPPSLVAAVWAKPTVAPDKRFIGAWSVKSISPGWGADDLSPYGREALLNPVWSPAASRRFLEKPGDARIARLAESIITTADGPIPLEAMNKRVWAIRDWVVSNCTYSATTPEPDRTIPDFLFKDQTGGTRQFALGVALLCRSVGVPSRVANGFCYRIARDDVRTERTFQIGDKHVFIWAEVYLPDAGWIPVHVAPPPIAIGAELAPPPLRLVIHPQNFWRHGLVLMALALGFIPAMSLWRRCLLPLCCTRSRLPVYAYRAAIDLLAMVGFRRHHSETREEFASRVASECSIQHLPLGLSVHFQALTRMHLEARSKPDAPQTRRADWLRALWRLSCSVTRCSPRSQRNPLSWIGADVPKRDGNLNHGERQT